MEENNVNVTPVETSSEDPVIKSRPNEKTKKTPFSVVEAYKTIRTNLTFLLPKKGCKTFMITSSLPGEGKSTTAINTAIAFSQLGKKVLLIDADMRKPTIHKKLKTLNTKGLFSVLIEMCTFEESVQHINPNFDVLTVGTIPPNPAEILASEALPALLDELKEQYEYIIFDSTPINVVSDALTLASKVDGVVIVVRDRVTSRRELAYAIETCNFANVKVLGAILNGANKTNDKYSYRKYSYRYQYQYGYGNNNTANK